MLDVLVVGELNTDMILSGLSQPPALGVELLAPHFRECLGSSSAICACVCASLGKQTGFVGKAGADARGELVLETLARYGVDASHVEVNPAYETGLTVCLSTAADRAMVTYFGDTVDCMRLEDVDLKRMRARHLHVGSYFLQTKLKPDLPKLFHQAKALGMTTSLDAGWDDTGSWRTVLDEVLAYTDTFFPNEKEAERIAGTPDMERAAVFIASHGCTAVIKLGARGAIACLPNQRQTLSVAGRKVRAVDTTGAGDSFNAGFIAASLDGLPLEERLRYANATGAVCVTRVGGTVQCPTAEDVRRMMNGA